MGALARLLHSRLIVSGELECLTPVRVGGIEADLGPDLSLARDGRERWYVPGTSIAGLGRQITEEVAGTEVADRLWGRASDVSDGGASLVSVADAVVQLPDGATPEIRDGVGIDRWFGAASQGIMYDQLVLPRGTRIPLYMEIDLPADNASHGELRWATAGLLATLSSPDGVRLGGGKTRGLGRIRLVEDTLRVREQDLATKKGIFEILEAGNDAGEEVALGNLRGPEISMPLSAKAMLTITIYWEPVLPTFVKAGHDGLNVDMLPLVGTKDGNRVALVLPGSAIKGALRSQAERIMRTVLGGKVLPTDKGENFQDQLNLPLVTELFGTARDRKGTSGGAYGAAAALSVDDCYAACSCAVEKWKAVEIAGEGEVSQRLRDAQLGELQEAFHVAVDRWTGGAAERLLYSVVEPHRVAWEPLRLYVDLARLGNERDAALTLLFLVLRDLSRGAIPLGHGVNRGHGAVDVRSLRLEGRNLPDRLERLEGCELERGDMGQLPEDVREHLERAWQDWVTAHAG